MCLNDLQIPLTCLPSCRAASNGVQMCAKRGYIPSDLTYLEKQVLTSKFWDHVSENILENCKYMCSFTIFRLSEIGLGFKLLPIYFQEVGISNDSGSIMGIREVGRG